jgi:hypothetical protein
MDDQVFNGPNQGNQPAQAQALADEAADTLARLQAECEKSQGEQRVLDRIAVIHAQRPSVEKIVTAGGEPIPIKLIPEWSEKDQAWGVKKQPVIKWKNGPLPKTPDEIRTVFSKGVWQGKRVSDWDAVGRRTGKGHAGIIVDLDPRHGGDKWFLEEEHRLPLTRTHVTPSGGGHLIFQADEAIPNSAGKVAPGVDIRGEGGIFLDYSLSSYGVQYPDVIAPMPDWLRAAARGNSNPNEKQQASGKKSHRRAPAGAATLNELDQSEPPEWSEAEEARIQSMLDAIPGTITRDEWLNIGRALHWLGWGERGRLLWVGFSRRFPEVFDEPKLNTQWQSFHTEGRDKVVKIGTLKWIAGRFGWKDPHADIKLDDFFACLDTGDYLHIPTRARWPRVSIDMKIGPIATGRDNETIPASLWLVHNRYVMQTTWAPGEPMLIRDRFIDSGGWIDHPGAKVFNTYRGPTVALGDPGQAGPWIEHVEIVFGEYTRHIIAYLAHCRQHPHEKINHALVLGGFPGIGKDVLLIPVRYAVGPWNFAEVSPKQVLGRFNGFLKSVVLRISEARDLGEVNQYAFYDATKTIMAAPPEVHHVDEKNTKEHAVVNVNGTILTSNYKHGLYLPSNDRRHYAAWSDKTMEEFEKSYWDRLFEFYNKGGIGHVAAYLNQARVLEGFDPKAPPPKTDAFWTIVHTHRSTENAELDDVLDRLGRPAAVTIEALKNAAGSDGKMNELALWLGDRKNRKMIPYRMEECGYVTVRNPDDKHDGQWKIGGRRQTVYGRSDLSPREQRDAITRFLRSGGG